MAVRPCAHLMSPWLSLSDLENLPHLTPFSWPLSLNAIKGSFFTLPLNYNNEYMNVQVYID